MADQTNAFPGGHREIHSRKRMDGAEIFFDAGQLDDVYRRFRHDTRKLNQAPG